MTSDDDDDTEAEAVLAKLPTAKQELVRDCMRNHGLTLAEAIADLTEVGGL
jgi:hypothetical protein